MLENQPTTPVLIEDLGYIYPKETSNRKRRYGLYRCGCGTEFKVQIYSIINGDTKSCGCHRRSFNAKLHSTHGLCNHRLYSVWSHMISRTTNAKDKVYNYYGGRGITVCDRWMDINNFIEDMDIDYCNGLSIDRIDNNLGYYKENCRWETNTIQSRNTRIIYSHNTSGFRGVSFNKRRGHWISVITLNNKSKYIGSFSTALEAAKAYDNYVIGNNLEHTTNKNLGMLK